MRVRLGEQAKRGGWMRAFLILVLGASLQALAVSAEARSIPQGFADLSARLSPAVVNISTTQTIHENDDTAPGDDKAAPDDGQGDDDQGGDDQNGDQNGDQGGGDEGDDQSGNADPFGDQQDQAPDKGQTEKVQSLGSGFVIDPSGIIVTNNHVIDGADKIDVTFTDGTTLPATVRGRDEKTDIAVLQVKTKLPLPYVKLGDSNKMRVGDWVMAIGNPFGLGGSVTAGIVSALNRDIHAGNYDDFIQTDAAINRGNSGGPLFNLNGEVIGMNTAIISPSGESVGIGFATPSSTIIPITTQIIKSGSIKRGWIGVRIQTVTPEIAETLGLSDLHGALVAGVTPGAPAAAAGIETGDLITGFDGQAVREMRDLPRIVAETEVGRQVSVDLLRGGDKKTVKLTVARLDDAKPSAKSVPEKKSPVVEKTQVLGLDLAALTAEAREHFKVKADVTGVLISDVSPSSAAADKGIRPGDVIIEVAQVPVKTPKDVVSEVAAEKKAGRKSVLMRLSTEGGPSFVALPIE
jgi:serine protease Do